MERFPTLAACHGCGGKFRTLFHVKPEDGPAATKVAEEVVSAILERISERVEGGAEEGMRGRLCHAMQGQGVLCAFVVQPLWSARRGGKETGWRRGPPGGAHYQTISLITYLIISTYLITLLLS